MPLAEQFFFPSQPAQWIRWVAVFVFYTHRCRLNLRVLLVSSCSLL